MEDLDQEALDIAKKYLLERWTLKELAAEYHRSPATLHRRLNGWLDRNRFGLIDNLDDRAAARVVDVDDQLGEQLAAATKVWRAQVATISGAQEAETEGYLQPEGTPEAHRAFEAHDRLHEALGGVAAAYLSTRLQRHMTVGVASGRGVGFTVMGLAELGSEKPSWVRGYESMRIESLCGGARVGAWALPTIRALDADENVFQLSSILNVPRRNLTYMRGWISGDEISAPADGQAKAALDLALVGLEVLNTRHQFFPHHDQNVQLGAIADHIQTIKALQSEQPDLLSAVAGVGHHMFLVGTRKYPKALREAVDGINERILAVPSDRIRGASEVIMVAGGAQKVAALAELLAGRCADAPVDLERLTLVTDSWTAREVLEQL